MEVWFYCTVYLLEKCPCLNIWLPLNKTVSTSRPNEQNKKCLPGISSYLPLTFLHSKDVVIEKAFFLHFYQIKSSI